MIESEVDIVTNDGEMNTFISHPEEGGPFAVIIFLMDAPGKRGELHDMARRLAADGYYVLLPNLYYRRCRDFVAGSSDAARKIMFEHMDSLSNQMVVEDCRALLEYAQGADVTKNLTSKGTVGVVGYCMSGPFAFAAAGQLGERIGAGASIHGVRLIGDNPDSPHLTADKIHGEMYFGCAEVDEWAPREAIDRLQRYFKEKGLQHRIEWYPGTQHGFVFPNREGKYHPVAAERHWERLFDLFRRNL
jgi:carboxymethylenebutenolidase